MFFKLGFVSPSFLISSVTSATWPKQSVVPRPRNLSPSSLNVKGEKSYEIKQVKEGLVHEKANFGYKQDGLDAENK